MPVLSPRTSSPCRFSPLSLSQFGSYIVDGLRTFAQPVFIYIPPHGTLRGGAWVVVDQTINPQYMEMYADDTGRAGVLETEGTLDVKFRKRDILAQAHRLDEGLIGLMRELKEVEGGKGGGRGREVVQREVREREEKLYPVYYQVANAFADLHDTPGRMQAKGCLQGAVPWEQARTFFYHRLQRRLLEVRYIRDIVALTRPVVSQAMTEEQVWRKGRETLYSWMTDAATTTDDRAFLAWHQANEGVIERQLDKLRAGVFAQKVKAMLGAYERPGLDAGDRTVDGLVAVINSLNKEQKKRLEEVFMGQAAQEAKKQ